MHSDEQDKLSPEEEAVAREVLEYSQEEHIEIERLSTYILGMCRPSLGNRVIELFGGMDGLRRRAKWHVAA